MPHPLPRRLDPDQERRALRLSFVDGLVYAVMVGAGESFFTADAIHLGASALEVGLVIGLPLLVGSAGPVVIVRWMGREAHRRPIVAGCAFVQGLGLLVIALLNGLGAIGPGGLIALLCLHQLCGQAGGAAWSSWFGDVVPGAVRGTWFARRTRAVQMVAFTSLLAAGLALNELEQSPAGEDGVASPGFALVFAVAGLTRLVSALMLWLSPEPAFRGLASRARLGRFMKTPSGRNVMFLLGGSLLYQASVYVSSPFFTPFMLEELRLSYAAFTAALGAVVAAKVLTLPAWGRVVDKVGARPAYRLAMVLTALVPAPWLVVDGPVGVWLAQAFSGLAWGGHEIALFALLLESSRASNRPHLLAAHAVCNATGQIGGSLCGAWVVGPAGYLTAFTASLCSRVGLALVLPGLLRAPRRARPRPELVLRVAGYRPGHGVVHRPMLGGEEIEGPTTAEGEARRG